MQTNLDYLCSLETNNDSLLHVLWDFHLMGLYGGFCQSEWSQDSNSNPNKPDQNHQGQTEAFTLEDFSFLAPGDVIVTMEHAIAAPEIALSAVDTCWRTQKNKQNGEKKNFSANAITSNCYMSAVRRICQRFVRLQGRNNTATPLSIYTAPDGMQTTFGHSKRHQPVYAVSGGRRISHYRPKGAIAFLGAFSARGGIRDFARTRAD